MRIAQKQEILGLAETLKEALAFLNASALEAPLYLQEDCLACVEAVCSVLSGEENQSYIHLQEACNSNIRSGNFGTAFSIAEQLSEWIENHATIHYEVVFLPYKAEMWDAFDSIWRAATMDPMCVVRTIPIPYQKLDGSQLNPPYHYEGDRFPSYVDITRYDDYDLSLHHPDVIFVHNPYDALNTVTRVHPAFFSSNLIQYTKKLAYVPYFIATGEYPPHFKLPIMKNAWRIFVQSEATRAEFLASGEIHEERVVAIGSPKLDYMINKLQEDEPMPSEWETALHGRTVFLFNTSLKRMLVDQEDYIASIKEVFQFFKKDKSIAIIWRPHPLIVDTIKSMRPHLLRPYLSLVESFHKMPNAVYDESGEMNTAILHSDAYIGDYSSVLVPYALTGKPILTRLPNIKASLKQWAVGPSWLEYKNELTVPITMGPGAICGHEVIFAANNRGGIYMLNLMSEELKLTSILSEKVYNEPHLYACAIKHQNSIWFVPDRASEVACYHYDTGEMKSYPLPLEFGCNGLRRFATAVQQGRHLWMLPFQSNVAVRLEMDSALMEPYELDLGDAHPTDDGALCSAGAIHRDELWIGLRKIRTIIQVNVKTGETARHMPDFLKSPVKAMVSDGKALWVVMQYSTEVVRWDPLTGESEVFNTWPKGFKGGDRPFSDVVFDGEWIWLVPHDANTIIRIVAETGKVSPAYPNLKKSGWSLANLSYPFDSLERNRELKASDALFSTAMIDGDWIRFCPIAAAEMISIHLHTGEIRTLALRLAREQDEKRITISRLPHAPKTGVDMRSIFMDRNFPLRSFINMVCTGRDEGWSSKQYDELCASLANTDGASGERIWEYIAGHLAKERYTS